MKDLTSSSSSAAEITLSQRREIASNFLLKVREEAANYSFPDSFETGYLRAMLDSLVCKFPEVASFIERH
jgi:hypothetical protein